MCFLGVMSSSLVHVNMLCKKQIDVFFFACKTTHALQELHSALHSARIAPDFHFLFCKAPECFLTTKIKWQTTQHQSVLNPSHIHQNTKPKKIRMWFWTPQILYLSFIFLNVHCGCGWKMMFVPRCICVFNTFLLLDFKMKKWRK